MQHSNTAGCILLKFYIKPQHTANVYNLLYVVSYRNSTSNHNMSHWRATSQGVVSYRNSTSNHNSSEVVFDEVVVVSYRNSTSNHNSSETIIVTRRLYLIEILHQTTTFGYSSILERCCILSKFYIKPQHLTLIGKNNLSCILSKFYIKPQLRDWLRYVCTVVSYRNSTSNHNGGSRYSDWLEVVSYRNSTSNHNSRAAGTISAGVVSYRNSTSNHNKPLYSYWVQQVVSYRNSTSNHNIIILRSVSIMLYLIEILHQTTTDDESVKNRPKLYLIEILHQTTTQILQA